MELTEYEKKHIEYLKENASECALFLKRDGEFPLSGPCKVCLVGNGARNTIKGGTGSGDVVSRSFKSIEETLTENDFIVTSTEWLDNYDVFRKGTKNEYIKDCKKLARKNHILSVVYSIGFFEEEKNYDFSPNYDGDACIYVLARNSGEGNDRRNIKGDVKLSDKEVEDILYLNNKFKKFMLVLNVGGVVDLSEVMSVKNILLLSQLGATTSDVFCDILLGKVNPSGKLTTTWAKPEDYPYFNEFGDLNDTFYKEGIYVGYRYFNTVESNILFPFGFGLSYTDFSISVVSITLNKMKLSVECLVKNTGKMRGKEVVQAYVSKPNEELDNPYVELCDYTKTSLLKPGEEEKINIDIDFSKLYAYDEKRSANVLLKGSYVIRVGNSSVNLEPIGVFKLLEDVILEKLDNKCQNTSLDSFVPHKKTEDLSNVKEYTLDPSDIKTRIVDYKKDKYVDQLISSLNDEELINMCIGHYSKGLSAIVGESSVHLVGGAGETCLRVEKVDKSLTMADGPAGVRITHEYGVDKHGIYQTQLSPLMEKMIDFLPKISRSFIMPKKHKNGVIHHQYTTAIPIGTALAQSFNDNFIGECAAIVAEEMKIFNVDLWLAPALNIHRNILCGRNFEYFSEDPYVSGRVAAAITKAVEKNKGLGVTIKHFVCNNQETNRNNNNSQVSERALREIYLKGFEMCIKDAHPKAIMTSYNLVNGTHTSESYELINDILRCEWGYNGLVMTDWIASGRSFCGKSVHLAPYASNNILAGNDLTMAGSVKDYKDIKKALKNGKLSRNDLVHSASRIYRSIMMQKGEK